MATEKKEKKEAIGTKLNSSSIVKKAEQKREAANPSTDKALQKSADKPKLVRMCISVANTTVTEFSDLHFKVIKELGEKFVYLTRNEVFIYLIALMDKSIDIDISNYKDLYDKYIAAKGRRYTTDRTIPKGEERKDYRWADFTPEQMETFKKVLTKLGVKIGVEKCADFSKQYFMPDIMEFFRENVSELAQYIKAQKNE